MTSTVCPADGDRYAWRRYGKGHHPAALNYGDCFSHALAMIRGEALLFKVEDFAKTDVNRLDIGPTSSS